MHRSAVTIGLALSLALNAFCAFDAFRIRRSHSEAVAVLDKAQTTQLRALGDFEKDTLKRRNEMESLRGHVKALCSALEEERKKTDTVRTQLDGENSALKGSLDKIVKSYDKMVAELPALIAGEDKSVELKEFFAGALSSQARDNVELQAENSGLRARILELSRLIDKQNAELLSSSEVPTQGE